MAVPLPFLNKKVYAISFAFGSFEGKYTCLRKEFSFNGEIIWMGRKDTQGESE
jgi:hypothetical protein